MKTLSEWFGRLGEAFIVLYIIALAVVLIVGFAILFVLEALKSIWYRISGREDPWQNVADLRSLLDDNADNIVEGPSGN